MTRVPEDVSIHVSCQELAEVLQLARVGQKRGKAKRSHWVVLFTVFSALFYHCFVDLQRNSKAKLKGDFLQYRRVTIVLIVQENIP